MKKTSRSSRKNPPKQSTYLLQKKWPVYLLLTVLTLVAFWQVTSLGFLDFDDPLYMTNNLRVQEGLRPGGGLCAFTTNGTVFLL